MSWGLGRQTPALVIASIALFVALGGSVYAATQIDGSTIKTNSMPGNRVKTGTLPANRFKVASVPGDRLEPGTLTGVEVDASTLAQVPEAAHAETAETAHSAASARNATNAINAERVDGHAVGCGFGTRLFAGACWQIVAEEFPATAAGAAVVCGEVGGELPDALSLVAFSKQPGIRLAVGDEWSGDMTNVSGLDTYAVVTVSDLGKINSAVSTATKLFRCVIPLVS